MRQSKENPTSRCARSARRAMRRTAGGTRLSGRPRTQQAQAEAVLEEGLQGCKGLLRSVDARVGRRRGQGAEPSRRDAAGPGPSRRPRAPPRRSQRAGSRARFLGPDLRPAAWPAGNRSKRPPRGWSRGASSGASPPPPAARCAHQVPHAEQDGAGAHVAAQAAAVGVEPRPGRDHLHRSGPGARARPTLREQRPRRPGTRALLPPAPRTPFPAAVTLWLPGRSLTAGSSRAREVLTTARESCAPTLTTPETARRWAGREGEGRGEGAEGAGPGQTGAWRGGAVLAIGGSGRVSADMGGEMKERGGASVAT